SNPFSAPPPATASTLIRPSAKPYAAIPSSIRVEQLPESYLATEKKVKVTESLDAVLVSVDSFAALERAYPNYFADARVFVELMRQALAGRQTEIYAPSLL
ncbi:MAG: hypothetical protein ACREFK_16395, partial [Stellaceae bacterium]